MTYEWQITCVFDHDPVAGPYAIHAPFQPFAGLRLGETNGPELRIDTVRYNFTEAAFEVTARAFGSRNAVEQMLTMQAEREWNPAQPPVTRVFDNDDVPPYESDDIPF